MSGYQLAIAQVAFTLKIIDLSTDFDFSVSSWIRTPERNTAVGGHPRSKHLSGLAVDVVLDSNQDQNDFLLNVKALGLVYLIEPDHIHVQVPKGFRTT